VGVGSRAGALLIMQRQIKVYVSTILILAVAAFAAIVFVVPSERTPLQFFLFLALMGVLAEALVLRHPSGATTSIASVPFQALALISPDWTAVAAITTAAVLAQLMRRCGWLKGAFNVAQTSLATATAIGVFRLLGGHSLQSFQSTSFLDVMWSNGVSALAYIAVFFFTNTLLVSGAIAIAEHRPVVAVWRHNHLSTLPFELLSAPFAIFFAWATVRTGPMGAILLSLPAIGLRQLYKTKLELERSYQDMLELMVKAMEARDPYTSGHSRRVQYYSVVIARMIGLSEREIHRIGIAALLHDVGKIHEKYAPILRKPDRLTDAEWRIMEEHPVDGASLIATVSQMRDLVPAVRHHHERWDGAGYPDRLSGEAIPLASRVITFADTIDAMTTARPYRDALGEGEVRAELIRCKGAQFDPSICETILQSSDWATFFAGIGHRSLTPGRHRLNVVSGEQKRMRAL
jgi:HD-GYP domain-containing protein (c-di-GMP phosphodiesterase class II)